MNKNNHYSNSNIDKTGIFFKQWNIYRKIIINNYMHHNEIFGILCNYIKKIGNNNLSILELGCGDANHSSKLLSELKVANYHCIDLSDIALDLASKNLSSLKCNKKFILGDFLYRINDLKYSYDVILAGYSLHHIEEKNELIKFFSDIKKILNQNGTLFLYDCINKKGLPRNEHNEHYQKMIKDQCLDLNSEKLGMVINHINDSDFHLTPEEIIDYSCKTGLCNVKLLFEDNSKFHNLYAISR